MPGRSDGPLDGLRRNDGGAAFRPLDERAGTVCARGDVVVMFAGPVAAPAAGLLSAAREFGVLPDVWAGARCDGSVVVGMLPLDGWRGVVVLWPSAVNVQKNPMIAKKARIPTDRKIKYPFFGFIKKITFAKTPLFSGLQRYSRTVIPLSH